MTTFDKLVSSDLATLAAHSRQRLPAVDDALRAVWARRERARAASQAPEAGALALFPVEALFAQRVARAAAGAMGLLCTLVLLVALHAPGRSSRTAWYVWSWLLDRGGPPIAVAITALMMAAYAAGGSIARGRFVRALERAPGDDARVQSDVVARIVRSADGASVALAIGGVVCAAVLVAVMTWLVGWEMWRHSVYLGPSRWSRAPFLDEVRALSVALSCVVAAAVALGWACMRPRASGWVRALDRRIVVAAGAMLASATVWVALRLDVSTLRWAFDDNIPSGALRGLVMVTGAIAVFLIAAAAVLRLRRRESDRLDAFLLGPPRSLGPASAPSSPGAEPALLALAGVFRQRIARIAGGAVAVVYALTLLVVIHHPFSAPTLRDSMDGEPGFHWTEWFLYGRGSGPVLAVALVVVAQLLAGRLAGRAFERRLRGLPTDGDGRSAVELGRRLVQRLDGASAALGIAGVVSSVALLAVLGMAVGDSLWVFLQVHGPRSGNAVSAVLRDCVLVSGVSIAAALAVGRACAREGQGHPRSRWLGVLAHRAILPLGVVVGIVAGVIGANLDFGVFDISLPAVERPPLALELGLVAMTAASALLVTTSYTLRRRRAEQARLGLS